MSRIRRRKAVRIKRSKQIDYNRKLGNITNHNCDVPENKEYSRIDNAVIDIGFKHDVFDDSIGSSLNIYEVENEQ